MSQAKIWRALNRGSPNFITDSARYIQSDPDIKKYAHIYGNDLETHWALHSAGIDPPEAVPITEGLFCYFKMDPVESPDYWGGAPPPAHPQLTDNGPSGDKNAGVSSAGYPSWNVGTISIPTGLPSVNGVGYFYQARWSPPYETWWRGVSAVVSNSVYILEPPVAYQVWCAFLGNQLVEYTHPGIFVRTAYSPIHGHNLNIDGFGIQQSNNEIFIFNQESNDYTGYIITPGDTWHHIILNYPNATTASLYIDGTLIGSYVKSSFVDTFTTFRLHLGNGWSTTGQPQRCDVCMGDMAFWTRALTSDEITWLWNGGSGRSIL